MGGSSPTKAPGGDTSGTVPINADAMKKQQAQWQAEQGLVNQNTGMYNMPGSMIPPTNQAANQMQNSDALQKYLQRNQSGSTFTGASF
jgi:hypothetical protein